MDKIGAYTGTADTNDEFTEGNPSTGTPATEVDGDWLNAVQRELVKVIESMGLTLDTADDTLLWQAFEAVYGKTFAGDPNGNVAANVLRERCWDTSTSPPTLYIATTADGTAGGTTWERAFPKPTVRAVGVLARHQNLVIQNNSGSPNSQIDIDADELEVYDANGIHHVLTSVDLTVDITAPGANGVDTGAEASDTWYHLWCIYNPITDTVAGLLSTASAFGSLTLPSGYTLAGYVGAIYNNSSSDLITIYQIDRYVAREFVQVLTSGTATTQSPVDISLGVPPTARAFSGDLSVTNDSGGNVAVSRIDIQAKQDMGKGIAQQRIQGTNMDNSHTTRGAFYCPMIEPQTTYYEVNSSDRLGDMYITAFYF